jgi:hypothetical protein
MTNFKAQIPNEAQNSNAKKVTPLKGWLLALNKILALGLWV